MNKLSLKVKLAVGFGALLVIMAALAMVSYLATLRFAAGLDDVKDGTTQDSMADLAAIALETQTSSVRGYMIYGKADLLKGNEEGKKEFRDQIAQLTSLGNDDEKKMLASIFQKEEEYGVMQDNMIQLRRSNKMKEAITLGLSPHMADIRDSVRQELAAFRGLQDKQKDNALVSLNSTLARTKTLTLALALFGISIGLIVAILIVRSMTGTIARMLSLIQEVAANNLSVSDMQITSEDEIGQAGAALNGMKNSLRGLIRSIAATAEHVASASEELSATSQEITANSEETSTQAQVVSPGQRSGEYKLADRRNRIGRNERKHQGHCQERPRVSKGCNRSGQGR